MFDIDYRVRIVKKFRKYARSSTNIVAVVKILLFIIRDFLNVCLTKLLLLNQKNKPTGNTILFFEPKNQGYGDLIFQTPIFEALATKGFQISILIQKKHLPIIIGNPHLTQIYLWEDINELVKVLFNKYTSIIFLGKSTLTETIFACFFINAKKIILDQNTTLWKRLFLINHTRAWQVLIKTYFDSNLTFKDPRIYYKKDKPSLLKRIVIVAGIDKREKEYKQMTELLDLFNEVLNIEIYLVGLTHKENKHTFDSYRKKPFNNLIDKLTYKETIQIICKANIVIGPEGSLIHISSTLKIPTIVIETGDSFWKYSALSKKSYVKLLPKDTRPDCIYREALENLS